MHAGKIGPLQLVCIDIRGFMTLFSSPGLGMKEQSELDMPVTNGHVGLVLFLS